MAKRPSKPKSVIRERTSSVADLASFAGVNRTTIYEWKKIPGYPIAKDGTVCKWDLCEWVIKRAMGQGASCGEDEEMVGNADGSYWLEKFREQRAGLAELELLEKKRQLVDRAHIHGFIMRVSSLFRDCLDVFQRQHGQDVYKTACDLLANVEAETRREFGSDVGGVDESKRD